MAFKRIPFVIFILVVQYSDAHKTVTLNVERFIQPDDVDFQYELSPKNDTKHCARECVKGDNRICYYNWVVENYAVLSAACGKCLHEPRDCKRPQCVTADGFEKGILTANRRLPGPGIHVCLGDWVIVDVRNHMLARTLSIHWHGIYMKGRSYMDGVPFISQCPIPDEAQYRYVFLADHQGTNYWHSHSGLQKLNGLQGSLIVRQPKEDDPVSGLYDRDCPAHVIFVSDWTHSEAEERLPGLMFREVSQESMYYTINGLGRYKSDDITLTRTPQKVFHVRKGKRYRFRLIGGMCTHCPARFQIEGHKLLVIATDGNPIQPVLVDSIEYFSGERYDFVLHASNEITNYWIQVRGMDKCFLRDICQVAVLRYDGAGKGDPLSPRPTVQNFNPTGVVLNPVDGYCRSDDRRICITQLRNLLEIPTEIFAKEPNYNIELRFGFHRPAISEHFRKGMYTDYLQLGRNLTLVPWINHIQQDMPPSPMVTQFYDIPRHVFCPNGTDGLPTCPQGTKDVCTCVPVIHIALGSVVQLVLIDMSDGSLSYPFHLHGYGFNVISAGKLPPSLMNAKDINGLLRAKELPFPRNPVMKDTLAVPSKGYAVIRFIAHNPGFWFFHCHYMYHNVVGMGTIIQVGHPSEHPSLPSGLPKCGDYVPPVKVKRKRK
ncbi:uncharacterized protein [Periplaneta americana]|uniref:uncharacterized protein n=1 Tax=Periplaneta americana TaxID=6978 RepID=UPI0037E711F0